MYILQFIWCNWNITSYWTKYILVPSTLTLIYSFRVVVIDKVTDFLLFLGKLVVVSCTGNVVFSCVQKFKCISYFSLKNNLNLSFFTLAGISFYLFSTDQQLYKGIPQLNYNLLPPIVSIFITLLSIIVVFFTLIITANLNENYKIFAL